MIEKKTKSKNAFVENVFKKFLKRLAMNFIQSAILTSDDVMTNLNQLNLFRVTKISDSLELYHFYNIRAIKTKPTTQFE